MAAKSESSSEKKVYMAKLAEQAERYEEMKDYMKEVVQNKKNLDVEERNLLSVAYKNVVGARRASWRVLNSIANKEHQSKEDLKQVEDYKAAVEKELTGICQDVLDILTNHLLKNSKQDEERVFYYKMKGDYHRYMAEYLDMRSDTKDKDETRKDAKKAYEDAMEAARTLSPTNPIRLGLALNFSVFYYEILRNHVKACELAKKAFDDAVGELEDLDEDKYKDATLIMQLLRDNLTLWQTEGSGEQDVATVERDMDVTEMN